MKKVKNYLFFALYLLSRPELLMIYKKVYLPVYIQFEWLKEYNIKTVIDIGAYHGEVSRALLHMFPSAKVYAFEAIERECQYMQMRINSKNFILNNIALSDKKGKADFYITDYAPTSSLLQISTWGKKKFRTISVDEKIVVPTITLDQSFKNIKLKKKVFLKIDVQGAEMLVFNGAKKVLEHVDIIHIETSFKQYYENQAYFSDIYAFLTECGFHYMGSINDAEFYPSFSPESQENSIFIRL